MPRYALLLIVLTVSVVGSSRLVGQQPVPVTAEAKLLSLADVTSAAIDFHPAIRAAELRVVAAGHRAYQAGLLPNPSLGVFGNEVGNDNSGQYGAMLSQTLQTAGKRFRNRDVQQQQTLLVEQQLFTTTQRILTDVRLSFYKLLVTQQQLELTRRLYQNQLKAVENAKQLYDAQESPKTQLLQIEVQAERVAVRLSAAEAAQTNAWRELASLCGFPDTPQEVSGSLDEIVEPLDWSRTLETTIAKSPAVRAAETRVARARAVINQQMANGVPNVGTQLSVGHDTGTDDVFSGFQVTVPLQIHNWNQGNIAAAQSAHQAACLELQSTKQAIQKKLAGVFQEYEAARQQSNRYVEKILPKSRETLDLVTQAYQESEVSFLQLLTAQQNLINVTVAYLETLKTVWLSRQKIEGFLLMDSQDN